VTAADPAERSDSVSEEASDTAKAVPDTSTLGRVALAASSALLVVAVIAAAWFGAGWVRAALTDGPRADARDTALDAARQAALNMTSMNIDDVPGSLALARSSMTGPLLDSATKNKDQAEKLAQQSGIGMTSKVLGAALTSLSSEEDKASALVVLQVTENGKDKPPADYRYTWTVDLAKDGAVWKAEQISSLSQPVLLNGGPAQQTAAPAADQPPAAPKPGS
jgi:Mce-associated membrane protein